MGLPHRAIQGCSIDCSDESLSVELGTRSFSMKSFPFELTSSNSSASKSHSFAAMLHSVSLSLSPRNGESPDNLKDYFRRYTKILTIWFVSIFLKTVSIFLKAVRIFLKVVRIFFKM